MIDIIIPAYNAKKYLNRCLLSINMQTIKELLNIYIINDCSNESYEDVISLFTPKLNIKEICLDENKGPGNARNIGINNSDSEYIFFMDSDDELVNSVSLELLFNSIHDADLCIGGVIVEDECNNYTYVDNYKNTLHGKLFRRTFLNNNSLSFNSTYRSEDNSFYNLCLLCNPSIIYVNKPIYFYRFNKDSLTDVSKDLFIESYNYNVWWVIIEAENRNISFNNISKYLYKSFIYNYYLFNNYSKKFDKLLSSFRNYVLAYYDKYKNGLTESEKIDILSEYNFESTDYISIEHFYIILTK